LAQAVASFLVWVPYPTFVCRGRHKHLHESKDEHIDDALVD